jgi:hypothetical protein
LAEEADNIVKGKRDIPNLDILGDGNNATVYSLKRRIDESETTVINESSYAFDGVNGFTLYGYKCSIPYSFSGVDTLTLTWTMVNVRHPYPGY